MVSERSEEAEEAERELRAREAACAGVGPVPCEKFATAADLGLDRTEVRSLAGVVVGDERVELGVGLSCVVHRPAREPAYALLIVLHGLGDHAHYQDEIVRACLSHPRTAALAIDFPGHGLSKGIRGHVDDWEMDYLMSVEKVLAYGACVFPEAEFVLYGNSMGGLVALELALDEEKGSRFATVLASAPMLALPVNNVIREGLRGVGWLAPTKTVEIDPKAQAPRHGQCTMGWLRQAAAACDRVKGKEGPVLPPLTLFVGTNDPIVKQADLRAFADKVGCDSMMLYPDSGHEPFADDRFGRQDKNKHNYLKDVAMFTTTVAAAKEARLSTNNNLATNRFGADLLPQW